MNNKFLYQPVNPFSINQGYAFNLPCVEKNYSIPLDKRKVVTGPSNTTCPVNYEKLYPLLGLPQGHNGLDLKAYHGQPVYAACEGIVYEIQTEEARGLGLGIVTENKYFCNETGTQELFKVRYWHLMSFNVKMQARVKKGDLIGYADNTGFSSGDHLHFEIKPVSDQVGFKNILQNNGYFGAVDPLPYLDSQFAKVTSNAQPQLKDYPTFFAYAGALTRYLFKKQNGYDEPLS